MSALPIELPADPEQHKTPVTIQCTSLGVELAQKDDLKKIPFPLLEATYLDLYYKAIIFK